MEGAGLLQSCQCTEELPQGGYIISGKLVLLPLCCRWVRNVCDMVDVLQRVLFCPCQLIFSLQQRDRFAVFPLSVLIFSSFILGGLSDPRNW